MKGCACKAYLGRAKIAELELVGLRVDKQVLGLDVAVADAHGVDVRESAAHLEHVQLHEERGHALAALAVVLADAKHCLRDILQHQVQVHLLIQTQSSCLMTVLCSHLNGNGNGGGSSSCHCRLGLQGFAAGHRETSSHGARARGQ